MKTSKRRIAGAVALLLAAIVVIAAGCSSAGGRKLTVLPTDSRKSAPMLSLARAERLEQLYCAAWLSAQEALCAGGAATYGENMFVGRPERGHGRPSVIAKGSAVAVSPGLRYAFVTPPYGVGAAAVVDLAANTAAALPFAVPVDVHGSWDGDRTFLTPTFESGRWIAVHSDGTWAFESAPSNSDAVKIWARGEQRYALERSGRLLVSGADRPEEARLLCEGVADFVPSPEGGRLAIVTGGGDADQSLAVLSLEAGSNAGPVTLLNARLLRQLAWSPDGKLLAFAAFGLSPGISGLYVAHAATGGLLTVVSDTNLNSPIMWSPSSRAFMVIEERLDGSRSSAVTTVYTLNQ